MIYSSHINKYERKEAIIIVILVAIIVVVFDVTVSTRSYGDLLECDLLLDNHILEVLTFFPKLICLVNQCFYWT